MSIRDAATPSTSQRNPVAAFAVGAGVGILGGLIGLGGAEFRLPLLIGLFGFAALEAVILNKATSLIVVASSLILRSHVVPLDTLVEHTSTIAMLLGGTLVGAWVGADIAIRLGTRALHRTIALSLLAIAVVLMTAHDASAAREPVLEGFPLIIAGVSAGFVIGVVASLLGVAGGELLIPTLVLLFAIDIKTAGSVSLAVSLPTMIVGMARYSRSRSFETLFRYPVFVMAMTAGSVAGAFVGGRLLGLVPGAVLLPLLAVVLVISAMKVWRHE